MGNFTKRWNVFWFDELMRGKREFKKDFFQFLFFQSWNEDIRVGKSFNFNGNGIYLWFRVSFCLLIQIVSNWKSFFVSILGFSSSCGSTFDSFIFANCMWLPMLVYWLLHLFVLNDFFGNKIDRGLKRLFGLNFIFEMVLLGFDLLIILI